MVEALTPICTSHKLGFADCFAAAASMAVEETSYEGATLARVPLFFGREDAPACGGFTQQSPEATFPAGQDGMYRPTGLLGLSTGDAAARGSSCHLVPLCSQGTLTVFFCFEEQLKYKFCVSAGFGPTFSYFEDVFGFTQRETVAIMGAHSLGRGECVPAPHSLTSHQKFFCNQL